MFLYQQHQGHRDHQFVGHRIEERAERRALLQASGQVTIQPVRRGGEGKDRGGGHVTPVIRQIEQQNEDRDEQDA